MSAEGRAVRLESEGNGRSRGDAVKTVRAVGFVCAGSWLRGDGMRLGSARLGRGAIGEPVVGDAGEAGGLASVSAVQGGE